MGAEWKRGDVGITAKGTLALRRSSYPDDWIDSHGAPWSNTKFPTNVRPLVVIDPEDHEQVSCLVSALRANSWTANTGFIDTRAALRSLVAPAKPSEPTGLGAVVEDAGGGQWIRYGHGPVPWMYAASSPDNRDPYPWDQIAAVKVLSEGVTA